MKKKFYIFFILIFYNFIIFAKDQDIIKHVLEGNLSLPTSQQPGPIFCFGQNVIDKGDFQGYIFIDSLNGKNETLSDIVPYFIYGITDNLSLSCYVPISTKFKIYNTCSSGIEDIFAQLEYAFYNKDNTYYANQATIVTAISFPTGSTKKIPNTGLGSTSIFLGLTGSHMSVDWYFFGSPGMLLTTSNAHKNSGNIFYYQFGIGRNLNYISSKRIITLLIEFFGASNSKNNKNSLTNTINKNLIRNGFFIGPSLWISTPKIAFNTGLAFSVDKNKINYFFAAEMGYKFN